VPEPLQNEHREVGLGEVRRGDQAVVASADDDDVVPVVKTLRVQGCTLSVTDGRFGRVAECLDFNYCCAWYISLEEAPCPP